MFYIRIVSASLFLSTYQLDFYFEINMKLCFKLLFIIGKMYVSYAFHHNLFVFSFVPPDWIHVRFYIIKTF